MESTIEKILKDTYTDGVLHTHVSLIKPKGKFQFNRQNLEKFWDLYCKLIEENNDPMVGVAEKPQQYLPIIVDIDLRMKDDGEVIPDGLYTDQQLISVVQVYQSVLRHIVDNCEDKDLTCVVLEKDMYQQTKNDVTILKHGFHLHFPYIFLDKVDQELQLIPRVQQSLKEMDLFKNLGIDDSGSVVDKVCCKVPWLLYGSRKSPEHQPYKVTRVFDSKLEEITLEKAFKYYEIFDSKEQLIPLKGKINHYLPRILSIISYGRKTNSIKRGTISPLKEKLKKECKSSGNHRKMGVEEALTMAGKLLPMLSDFRASDRNEWMTIGWLLFNISDGHPDGLDMWCDFSSRCEDKYDENGCIYQWERMTKKDLTIGTLRYFASVDNPTEYRKFKEEQSQKHILASLEGSHNDVAKALFAEYGDEFVCASITNNLWFQFSNHKWEQIEDGVYLREKISGKIVGKFAEASKSLVDKLAGIQDNKGEQAMINTRLKQLNKMIANLKMAPYKSNVMKECKEVFYDSRFQEKLDADAYIIAFKNGVYDLRNNIFRPGRPEDFMSKNMPINYVNFSEDDEKVQDMYTFLEQVFPDKSVRKYFLDVSSDIFVGGNHEKIVVFWTGEGDNGKSVTQSFFEQMLGKLAVKLNTNVITGKKPGAGSAFADLARVGGGVRWAVLEEPDGDEAINVGIFKHLSGNDSIYARDLFERGKDGREIQPLFKLVFICNKLPRIKHADKAVWNRVRVIPFESVFCKPDNPAPESYDERVKQKRFPMDKQFSKKIPTLVEAFAWILLQHRIKIAGTVRVEPDKVRSATEFYRRQNDIYRQFIEEQIMEHKEHYMSLTELYSLFKEWFRDSLPGHSVPVKNEVEDYFVRLWGNPEEGKRWKGYKQRTLEDKIKDGDVVVLGDEDLVDYSSLPDALK
jgi:P4 family phage/plasmid primase-like protien